MFLHMCKTNSRPRRRWRVSIPALVCGVVLCVRTSGAWADGLVEAPVWTFGSFGSVGLAHSSERHADYSANVLNPGGAGNTHRVSVGVDSRIGAQLGLNLNSQWSATLQVVSERNLQNSYRPAVEWANIKYQMTSDFSLRLGRIALPIFLAGDYRKAAYALPGARPPVEVYGTIPLASTDGIDASYRWHTTDFNHQTQVFFGHAVVKIDDNGNYARARQTAGLSNTASSGALTIRVSAMTAGLTVDLLKPLFDTFRLYGPQGAVLADTYGLDHKRATIGNLGISYDPGNWFLMSEVSRFNTRSFLGDRTAFYAPTTWRC